MELIDIVPEFNLYEEYWKIYTKSDTLTPQYISSDGVVERSLIGEGATVCGEVYSSIIGCNVEIGKGAVIRDSIIMNDTVIGEGCEINKTIIAENTVIGPNVRTGIGEEAENETDPRIYNHGLVCIGEHTTVPGGVTVGKNTVIFGKTDINDYPDKTLASGKSLIKEGV